MAERAQSLQDTFLNHVRKNKTPLTIFLINGVKLQGIVTWFDNFCVLLRRDGHSQLVYKHAISTIMPGAPVHLMDSDQAVERGEFRDQDTSRDSHLGRANGQQAGTSAPRPRRASASGHACHRAR